MGSIAMAFRSAPVWALLAGAALWGVIWYPYRLLAAAGLDGPWATLCTYGLAFLIGCVAFPRHARVLLRLPPLAIVMGLAIGWSNLAYVLAILEGEVVRVLLLFYLAPLWTVPLARVFLKERLDARGLLVMALAFSGAMVMLWHPERGLPWPHVRAEWLGLAAGFLFALGNVLVRKLEALTDMEKSIVIWAGVVLATLAYIPGGQMRAQAAFTIAASQWMLVVGLGISLVAMGYVLQYGLSRMPANRAIVILLSELAIAAIAAYVFAGETLRLRDWAGGGLIAAATLASAWPSPDAPRRRA